MFKSKAKNARPRKTSDIRRFALYLWTFKVTPAGKYLISGTLLATSIAVWTLDIPVFHLVSALSSLCAAAWVAGWVLRPRVRISGQFPPKASVGQTLTGTFAVANRSRLPVYDLSLGLFQLPDALRPETPGEQLPELPAGKSAALRVAIEPIRRGLYELPAVRAFSTFPFGLFRAGSGRLPLSPLMVLPQFHPITSVSLSVGSRYQPGGVALTSNVGESPEYIGNRDYRPGDSLRRLDHRSWARLARPVVREYQEEYYLRVALVLDTYIPAGVKPGPGGFAALEAAVSLAAAVADAMSRGEYLIDIFAAGPELHVFRAGRHTAHFENIMEILACVDACRTNPFDVVAPALADELGNISTVVCLFLDWDESRERMVRIAREVGCATKVYIVRDGETSRPFHDAQQTDDEIVPLDVKTVREGGVDVL